MLGQPWVTLNSQDSPWPGLERSHHLPQYIILYSSPWGPHPNGFLSQDSQVGVPKFQQLGLSRLWKCITSSANLRSRWGQKQSCNPHWELSNSVSHSTCTHWSQFNSRLLMVRSQTINLTLALSFCHNLCYRCPNGSCEPIFDIYTLISFQWCKERLDGRCFDPCNQTLKFQESLRTPKSPFWEWRSHPLTLPK
jgi:hypothetical protein